MRLALTVVSPTARQMADVILDADPTTPVAGLAAELEHFMLGGRAPDAYPAQAGQHGQHGAGTATPAAPGGGAQVLQFPASRMQGSLAMSSPAAYAEPLPIPLYVNYQIVSPQLTLAESPIRDGSVISLGSPEGGMVPEPTGLVEIRVIGGPGVGSIHRLGVGEADIGGGATTAVRIPDPAIPEYALRIAVDSRGGCQVAAYEGVQVTLDREPLAVAAQWRPGQQIALGGSMLGLAPYEPPDAALHPSSDGGGIDFNRPPRLLPPERITRFQLPTPPGEQDRRPIPLLMAVVPLLMGVGMAYFLHQIYMLAMAGLTPVMLLGSYVSERKQGRKSYSQRVAEYREHKDRIERDAAEALETERIARRDECPDPATVLSIASGPRRRLWERRRSNPDYLLLRVGTADLPSAVELTDPEQDEHRRQVFWQIPDAPVTVPLAQRGVLGVAGPGDTSRAVGRWLVAQLAALHSPNDLQVCVLTDSSGRMSWEWVRWLPHCRPSGGRGGAALMGNDAESVATRIAELLALIAERQKARRQSGQQDGQFQPDVVVVFDGSRKLRSLPGSIQLLREGPAVGVYAVCLDADERLLPAECQAVVVVDPDGLRVQQMMTPTVRQVRPDGVNPGWCTRLARSIAPIRDASDDGEAAGLPDSSRLLDVLRLEPPRPEAIAARWNAGGRSTLAMIGESYDGPFGIDLRKDGPHGLVAGTTGAGKSELLQSLVASLAVANRPDEMTFVLVDYKGGSAFSECVRLPHTVGMVTDLDTHLVERALVSLTAELTRREHILAAAGAKDIEDYQILLDRSRPNRGMRPPEPMPRLLIVIDEFASMVRDLPDFVKGLVNIAQRGRSLGIHLILATQRPSGVVSQDIRANTNLRIALRVTDPAESADVIEAPEAAFISKSTPGRAYVRLGHASLVPFQAGRVGGRRPGAAVTVAARPWLAAVDWQDLGRPEPARPAARQRAEEEITDLKVLVEAIQRASQGLGVSRQRSPWLPPLPDQLLLSDLMPVDARARGGTGEGGGHCAFGIEDLPAFQQQRPTTLSLDAFSHLMAAGAPHSGRSQLLRTIAAALALAHSCADLHLYGIDCGNGALRALADLPHCGAVVTRTETERAVRLLGRLAAEVSRRQELLADGGFGDITEQRAGSSDGERLPHVVVLLDRWEGFTTTLGEVDHGSLTDVITRILGEGASVGVHLVMTGDRSLLAGRISALCEQKLAFKLAEKEDYGLIGLRARELPDEIAPGRAFRAGSGIEVQVALVGPDPSGPGQAAALRSIAASCVARDASVDRSRRPFRVDVLPGRITFAEAWAMRPAAGQLWGLVGVGGDMLAGLGPDLAVGVPCFAVAGPAKSGRSTILHSMAQSFLARGTALILVTPRLSPLRSLGSAPGVAAVFSGGADLDEEELRTALSSVAGPAVVMIDDAELLRDCDASGELSRIIAFGADSGRALVFAGDSESLGLGFSGWQVDAKRARRGCLTGPSTLTEGDLIGVRLTHSVLGQASRPGRCLLNVGDGTLTTVTVPTPAT
ncbi:MAG TPA: FtsK/SpoIIIE domain-containing protein [Trebonia sp.]|jgi:S-DNA-T family DNA segregation ATPase FtsK/SpoIIIE|nr:FtsK/SpoIIIE domain-containing protein [Trebonia sp.]